MMDERMAADLQERVAELERTSTHYRKDPSGSDKLVWRGSELVVPTPESVVGAVMAYAGRADPNADWGLCNGGAISRATYGDLYDLLVPLIGTFTVTIASPGVFTLNAHGLVVGDQVYLTTTGALPTGLAANTLYYVHTVAANTFRLATTRANADAATGINTSGSQSGVHSLRFCPNGLGDGSTTFNKPDYRGRTLYGLDTSTEFGNMGETGGAKTHFLLDAEMPSHTHTYFRDTAAYLTVAGGAFAVPTGASTNTGATGSGAAHNNLPPYAVANYIIRLT